MDGKYTNKPTYSTIRGRRMRLIAIFTAPDRESVIRLASLIIHEPRRVWELTNRK
jgi:hypothetical protein